MQSVSKNNLTTMKSSRDGSMDMLKFLLAMAIIIFHGKVFATNESRALFAQGASAVEGFFIISGYYMAKTALEKKKEPLDFMIGRVKGIIPYHLFAFSLAFLSTAYLAKYFNAISIGNIKNILLLLVRAVPEFLIFPPLGGVEYNLAGVINMEWYLSALLLGMAILYPILCKLEKYFCLYLGPLIFFILSGYMFQKIGTYRATVGFGNYISLGLVRAIALISIGTTVYYLANCMEFRGGKDITTRQRIFNTIVSTVCWIIVFGFLIPMLPKTTYLQWSIL